VLFEHRFHCREDSKSVVVDCIMAMGLFSLFTNKVKGLFFGRRNL
jgi:hypothetical protein